MCSEFVPASELYHVESRTPIAHPAHQATDADVRRALEAEGDREVCTDGGTDSSDTDHGLFWAGAPLTVRSELYHIYREDTGRSLCGKYRHGSMNAKSPVEEGDTWTDGGDCKACCRKADPVEVDDGE